MTVEALYSIYKKSSLSTRLRRNRYDRIVKSLKLQTGENILEVGCARGIDFAQFAVQDHKFVGVDIADVDRICKFEFHQLDARRMPWADQEFDCVVSIGVLEHIQPLDVLCQVSLEIRRLGKRFCMIVPSSGTWIEPHTWTPFWQLRDKNRKKPYKHDELNYLSDEAWVQLPGFVGAETKRYWHAPGIQNLMIVGGK